MGLDPVKLMPEATSEAVVPETPAETVIESAAGGRPILDELAEFLPEVKGLKVEAGTTDGKPAEAAPVEPKPETKPESPSKDKMQERIDELTRKNTEAAQRADAAEAELKQLREGKKPEGTQPANQPEASILDTVQTADEVQAKVDLAHKVLGLTKRYFRDGEAVHVEDKNAEGGKRELSREELQSLESEAEEILRNAPKRLEFLRARDARSAADREVFPEYFEGEGAAKVARMKEVFPELGKFEDQDAAAMALVIGFEAIAKRRGEKNPKPADGAGKGVAAPTEPGKPAEAKPPQSGKVPLAPPAPGPSASPRVAAEDLKTQEAKKALLSSSGSSADLEKFFGA